MKFKKLLLEKVFNSLMVDHNVDIYVTGSNSKISTYLTGGRYISIWFILCHMKNISLLKKKQINTN